MSLVYVQDTELTTVGKTIRKFTGTDTKYTPSEMCDGIKDAIANYAVKKTVTGTSIAVNDAAKFRPVEMKLYGKSTQATTKGNQLLDLPNRKNYINNGITLNLIDGVVTVSGQNTKGSENSLTLFGGYSATDIVITLDAGTYTLSDCNIGTRVSGSLVTYSGTFTLNETTGFTWVYTRGYKKDEFVNETTYPMINKGSTALPWEPYTGGIASPNPDYPQEVVPLGGSIEYNNQLFDADNIVNINANVSGGKITVTRDSADIYVAGGYNATLPTLFSIAQGQYSLGCSDSNVRVSIYYTTDNVNTSQLDSIWGEGATVSADASIVGIRIRSIDETSLLGKTFTIMFNAGDTRLEWEPYTGVIVSGSVEYGVYNNQLLNLPDVSETELNGVKLSCTSGVVTINGTATNTCNSSGRGIKYNLPIIAGTYYISGNYVYVAVKKSDGTFKYYCKTSFALDGTESSALVYINITTGTTVNETIYPMVNLGTTAQTWGPYSRQPLILQTGDGLHDLVSTGETIRVTDYIDLTRGKLVQHVKKFTYNSSTTTVAKNHDMSVYTGVKDDYINFRFTSSGTKKSGIIRSTMFPYHLNTWNHNVLGCNLVEANRIDFTFPYSVLGVTKDSTSEEKYAAMNEWLKTNTLEFYAELSEPIETDLTAEEIAQFKALYMNRPNTTILNDANAETELTYVVEPK